MSYSKTACLSILFLMGSALCLHAQHDTTYYVTYPNSLTTRFYFSQKYTQLTIRNKSEGYRIRYYPNTNLNMGIGATYRWFSLNLAYGWPFLNNDGNKGETRYVDLQFHGYGQKFTLDFLGEFYEGYYSNPKGTMPTSEKYIRPDLRVRQVGISTQYIFNHRKFSFRASALQSEWQKKSAGTFLAGVDAYWGEILSDSSMVPTEIHSESAEINEHNLTFFQAGVNAGYAYTLIISKTFFVTGQATGSLTYGFNTVASNAGSNREHGLNTNTLLRFCMGYNSQTWGLSIVYVNHGVQLGESNNQNAYTLNTGNLRANLVYRFGLTRKQNEALGKIFRQIGD